MDRIIGARGKLSPSPHWLIVLVFSLSSFPLFGLDKGMVITDVLNIRNGPGMKHDIVGKAVYGDTFYIYDTSGTDIFVDGNLDYWYKISDNVEKWVNGNYFYTLPFYITDGKLAGDIFDRDSVYFCYLYQINDIKLIDGVKFIIYNNVLDWNERDKEYKIKLTDEITYYDDYDNEYIIQIIDNKYEKINQFDITRKKYLEDYMIPENILETSEDGYHIYYKTDDCYIDFTTGWDIIEKYEIYTDKISLKYGIKIGRDTNYLKEIFGEPLEINDNIWLYRRCHMGTYSNIYFTIENNTIKGIKYELFL
jgi:hypothetical protein